MLTGQIRLRLELSRNAAYPTKLAADSIFTPKDLTRWSHADSNITLSTTDGLWHLVLGQSPTVGI
jgi:hypothetical protein